MYIGESFVLVLLQKHILTLITVESWTIYRWLPTKRGHGHSPQNITCPVCHKQQSFNWTCPVVVCDTFVHIRELVVPIGLVPFLFATRDLAVVNWTCPAVVCDISCGQWDLSRCCLRHVVYIRDMAVVSGTCHFVFCSQLDLSRCCLQPIGLVQLLFTTVCLYYGLMHLSVLFCLCLI